MTPRLIVNEPAEMKVAKPHWLDIWHVNPSMNRDYDFIDGLRGIAILLVLACHHFYVNPKSGPAIQFVNGVVAAGANGVKLFFALSGFLISWAFWKRKFARSEQVLPPGYGWRRFWKIYPPLALSIIVFAPIYFLISQDPAYLVLAAKWLAGLPFIFPVSGKLNPVMWTLVIEVQFYITLPLIFFALKKVSPKVCLWVVPLAFMLIPVVFQTLTGLRAEFHPDINPHFPSALNAFCLGILVAGLENAGLMKKNWAKLGIISLVLWPVIFLYSGWAQIHPDGQNFPVSEIMNELIIIASGCLLFYVANPRHPVAVFLCAPWLRWCGIVSYEWYLLHQPIIMWARYFFGPAEGVWWKYIAIVGGSFLTSLVLTALIYRFYSLPILKYGRSNAVVK